MFLFIFESLGTSELIMVGIIALIFLGPRKLPEIARKAGKIMADLRSTTSDFKSTWEREVNFEAEEKAIKTGEIEQKPAASTYPIINEPGAELLPPTIKSIDRKQFDEKVPQINPETPEATETPAESKELSDKRNWF